MVLNMEWTLRVFFNKSDKVMVKLIYFVQHCVTIFWSFQCYQTQFIQLCVILWMMNLLTTYFFGSFWSIFPCSKTFFLKILIYTFSILDVMLCSVQKKVLNLVLFLYKNLYYIFIYNWNQNWMFMLFVKLDSTSQ